MNRRNTKQKQLILETLCKDKTHPTIADLYQKVSQKDPRIGQATVYRNMKRFVKEGKVKRIPTREEIDRYDGNLQDHYHIICKICGNLKDIMDEEITAFLNKMEQVHQIEIDQYQVLFEGVCRECKKMR